MPMGCRPIACRVWRQRQHFACRLQRRARVFLPVIAGFGCWEQPEGGGCSGMTYILGFDKKEDTDEEFMIDGLRVFMNPSHQLYLFGMQVDYQDGLNARGFVFENPNATKTCGCGTSFSA